MKIPGYSRREDAKPLQDAIDRTASMSGYDRYAVLRITTFFLESIAHEVCLGHAVGIPGFGVFAPWLIETRSALARDPRRRCKPVFSPARGFQEQVRWAAPASRKGKQKIAHHRRNHSISSGSTRCSARLFTSMEAIRQSINAQMGHSLDWPEAGEGKS